jgi:inner membrane transporter RhtA
VDGDHHTRRRHVEDHPLEVQRKELVGTVGRFARCLDQADASAVANEHQPDHAVRRLTPRRTPDRGKRWRTYRHPSIVGRSRAIRHPQPGDVDNTGFVRPAEVVPAPVLVLAAIASVQSGAAIATKLFPQVGAGGAVFLRLMLSAVIVCLFVRPNLAEVRGEIRLMLGYGIVLGAMNLTFYLALDRIPLGVAVTIEFLGPLAVAIGGSRRRLDLLWVVLAATGVVLLAGGGGHLSALGVVFAAAAAVCWAAYILLAQRVGSAVPGMTGLAVALVAGAALTAPYGILDGGSALVGSDVLGKGVAIAVLSSAVPYSLELAALRRLRAATFGILMSLEPVMAALSGLLFLGQHLRVLEWVAVGCVMVASVGATSTAKSGEPVEMIDG